MGFVRIPKTRGEPLEHTFYDGETPTDSTATVTVAVTDANGTAVSSGNATSAGAGTGRYTYALPAQSQVAELTVAWTATIDGASVVETDTVEICGGHLFGLADARASDTSLADTASYPTSALARARDLVTGEMEFVTDRAWTERYARIVTHGNGTTDLVLTHPAPDRSARHVRSIRRAAMAPDPDGTFTDLTAAQLGQLSLRTDGTVRRADGNAWTEGESNIVVEYTYGLDGVPLDLVEAMYRRLRYVLTGGSNVVDERAWSRTTADGTTYRMATVGPYTTGMPETDGAYQRYSARGTPGGDGRDGEGVTGRRPASRQLRHVPQRHSLFHGWR